MDAEPERAEASGTAGARLEAVPHPLVQYGRMIATRAAPFRKLPPDGYRRGIDHFSASSIPTVISVAAKQFHDVHRRYPDLVSPTRYSDKIFWAKFFRLLKVPEAGNKLLTSSFIPREASDLVRCPTIVWHSPEARIPRGNEVEPGTYYLKANLGADRYRRLTYPITSAEADALDAEFAGHIANGYNWWLGEWWYNVFRRELLLEQAIGTAEYTTSWNFLVIAGEVQQIIVYQKLGGGAFRKSYLSPDYSPLGEQDGSPAAIFELPSQKAQERMSAAARAIGAPLRFVRVDFLLDDDDQPWLGEVTFTPGNAVARLSDELDVKLGSMWDLNTEMSDLGFKDL